MDKTNDPVSRRRTFAIISHPDAGKTTLTEKLLLFGGAIQLAGAVKARGEAPARPLGLDEGRAGARHLGHLVGDDLRVRRLHLQPARHPRPRGLQRGHLPHADRRRLGGDGDRRRQGDRGADPQAVRGLPAAQRADRHLHQQARPRGARSLRPDERDRAGPPAPRHPRRLADRHGAGLPRRLRPAPRPPGADGPRAPRRGARRRGGARGWTIRSSTRCSRPTPWPSCARRSRWSAASARRSTSRPTARGT